MHYPLWEIGHSNNFPLDFGSLWPVHTKWALLISFVDDQSYFGFSLFRSTFAKARYILFTARLKYIPSAMPIAYLNGTVPLSCTGLKLTSAMQKQTCSLL